LWVAPVVFFVNAIHHGEDGIVLDIASEDALTELLELVAGPSMR